jgi:hypothetical protein
MQAAKVSPMVAFDWQDYGRFVRAAAVEQGWFVYWGHHRDQGRTRVVAGSRTYADLDGARRRIADAVLELTGKEALVAEALVRFDRSFLATVGAVSR